MLLHFLHAHFISGVLKIQKQPKKFKYNKKQQKHAFAFYWFSIFMFSKKKNPIKITKPTNTQKYACFFSKMQNP